MADRLYACPRCRTPLKLAVCKRIERVWDEQLQVAHVRVVHACPCLSWVRSAKFPWDQEAMDNLFEGNAYQLPWPRVWGTEEHGDVQEGGPPLPSPHDRREALMERWRWDLEGVATAHDFLLFCRGRPQSDYPE